MKLWTSDDCAVWRAELDQYPATILAQNVRGLEELDNWYGDELPARLAERKSPYITRDELERVTKWKMKRGVWRERNRLLVAGNEPNLVKQTSREAFAAVPDPRAPIEMMSRLAGVGPATSSAVLAAYRPDIYPFFDELVAVQIPQLGKVAFTAAYYQRYAAALRERAAELNSRCGNDEWTAHALSRALWSSSGGKTALK